MIASHARPTTDPFVGPNPIPIGKRLFGRDWEIRMVRNLLVSRRLVLLHSPSGAGKTSLLQAGLLPVLTDDFQVRGPIRVNRQPPEQEAPVNRYVHSTLESLDLDETVGRLQ